MPRFYRVHTIFFVLALPLGLLGLGPQGVAAATVFGGDQSITATATQPAQAVPADLDGDGDLDVLTTASGDDTVAWFENVDGAGLFGPERALSALADGAWGVAAADLDGDGDLDVLVGAEIADTVLWYENTDGDGTFGPAQTVVASVNGPRFVAAADVDGDGDLDVVATARGSDAVFWYANTDGLGNFAAGVPVASGPNDPIWAEPADVDGDGDLDVLVSSSQDATHAWYENLDGAGSFALGGTITTGANSARAVGAVDVDGDGDLDAVGSAGSGDRLAWYENLDGDGSFGTAQSMPGSLAPQSAMAADLDQDGDLDLVAAEFGQDRLAWFENTDGDGTFAGPLVLSTAVDGAIDVRVADLDGDGDADVLGSARLGGDVVWLANESIGRRVAFGRAGERWDPKSFSEGVRLAAGDLDADGDTDGVVVRRYRDPSTNELRSTLAWYPNLDGRGGMGVEQAVATTAAQELFAHVVVVDMDLDRDLDLLATLQPSGEILWYENEDGAGTFGSVRTVSDLVPHTNRVCAADLDGDTDVDVVASSNAQTIYWYENADFAGGAWVQRIITSSAGGHWGTGGPSCADLDADGDLDVIASHYPGFGGPTELFWYENTDSEGSFGAPQPVSPGAIVSVLFGLAADYDGDGDLDVASLSITSPGRVDWHENTDGQGTFGATHPVTPGDGPTFAVTGLEAADLDADGDVDFLATRESNGAAIWFENVDGLGSFAEARVVEGGRQGRNAAFPADMDGDGDIDALTAFQLGSGADAYSELAWYEIRETESPAIRAPTIAGSQSLPTDALDIGDLDGDGDDDVLTASTLGGTLRWYGNPQGEDWSWTGETLTFTAFGPSAVRAADIDGDGDLDFLAATADDDTVVWYENIAGSRLYDTSPQVVTTVADGARTLEPADVDRDGDVDVIVGSALDDVVAWYENTDGLGSFGVRRVISGGAGSVRTVAAADLDGDGDLDVLSTSPDDDTVDWYENIDGLGGFGIRTVTTNLDEAWALAVADFDGDGDPDVAATGSTELAWYENTDGQATFGPAQSITPIAGAAGQLVATDFDVDGDLDLLVSSSASGTVSWLENTDGLGSFAPAEELTRNAGGVEAIASTDLDRDGNPDLIYAAPPLDRGIRWRPSRAGQYSMATTNVAPATAGDAEVIELLTLDFQHEGEAGDPDLEVASIALRLERAPRTSVDVEPTPALTVAEASALIDRLDVYRDDGSGAFEVGLDARVGDVVAFSLVNGVQTIALDDGAPEARLAAGAGGRFFVIATLGAAASAADPIALRIRPLADGTVAEYVGTQVALRRGPGPGALPRVVDLPEPGTGSLLVAGALLLAAFARWR
ncbi:MAG: VCBS repeat-containing protein [bacterium]|nr:VCBS repeat-containing protein [bacterium]